MKQLATLLVAFSFCVASPAVDQESAAGLYQSEVGIYLIRVALFANGNYLARWDGDVGSNGTSAGSWAQVGTEVRLTPKKEEGALMQGYLTTLLVREMNGRKALLRKEDEKAAKSPFVYLYLQQKANRTPDPAPPGGVGHL
jgi:hypothetical protein